MERRKYNFTSMKTVGFLTQSYVG